MDTKRIVYACLFFLLFAISCKKDTEVNKDTFKIEREEVAATTQSVRITGTYAYSGTIDGITLELGRQADLMDSDAYRTLLEGTDFSVEVKNLRTNVTYYYRYAVEYGGKSPYRTEIKSFKTEEYNLPNVESKEVMSVGVNRAEVSGEVKSDGGGDAVTLRGICWSMSHNPSVGDEYANAGEGIGTFTCELTNLQPEKTYYARAFAGNSMGISYGAELTFVTLAAGSLAEVRTLGISGNAMLQATVSGEVIMEGTSAVLERGICYGKEHYPTTSGLHVSSGAGAGEYLCQLTNLDANATYYVRAYAINSLGIAYGEEMSFVAMTETTVPVVLTNMVKDITTTSASGSGVVISDGGATVTRRGLCWSMEPNPTVDDLHSDCGNGIGAFNTMMPHLENMTTYYVRAYAENAVGMAYGEEVSFTVGQHEHADLPEVWTFEVMDITQTSAVGAGEIMNDGGAEVTERGLCWSTNHNPTTGNSHANNGSGMGNYSVQMTNLEPSTTYYVRAYARNSAGTAYGNEVEFVTLQEAGFPSVMTFEVFDITQTSAISGGEVMDDGGSEVTECGLCWSTSHNPAMNNGNHASSGNGGGYFEIEMTGLTPGTTYYVRAYATNSVGTGYGDEMEFVTLQAGLPSVMTFEVFDITQTSAICGGEVMDDGGSEITECGLCWSTSPSPTINNGNHASSGNGGGYFEIEITDLTPGTAYYVRAYATNSTGTGYGDEMSFTTLPEVNLPSVMTFEIFDITETSAIGGGEVMDDGGSEVTECGLCWSTSHSPTINNNHLFSENGSGYFEIEMTGLTPGTTYYVRAYAMNSAGVGYGDEVSFNTMTASGDEFLVDFESGMPAGWTTIDADGDGYNWMLGSQAFTGGAVPGHNGSDDFICSSSYDLQAGALLPDNYLVSPQVNIGAGSIFSFYACAQDASYAAEHFGVFVSDNGISGWTAIQEWTMTAKGGGVPTNHTRSGNRAQGNWYNYSVDLSAYAGQQVYIAIRHFNCGDMFYLDVDDIELTNAKKK